MENQDRNKWDTALIVGIFTLIGYLCAAIYNSAYLGYFGLSKSFLDLTTSEVLLIGSLCVLIAGLGFILAEFLHDNIFQFRTKEINRKTIRSSLNRVFWSYFTAFFIVYLASGSIFKIIDILFFEKWFIAALIFAIINFINWKLVSRSHVSESEGYENITNFLFATHQIRKFDKDGEGVTTFVLFFIFCVMALDAAFSIGLVQAKHQATFPIMKYEDSYIAIILIGDDAFVGRDFDNQTKTLGPKYVIQPINSDMQFTYANVGPLKPPNSEKSYEVPVVALNNLIRLGWIKLFNHK